MTVLCGVLLATLFLSGCEDVITVDLRNTEPKLVIEGIVSDDFHYAGFVISRTTDFYNPNMVEGVEGATIVVSDDAGTAAVLVDHGGGGYIFPGPFRAVAGRTYHARVRVDGVTYEASVTMPDGIPIDSLSTEYQPGGGIGTEEDEGYRLHVYFQDVAGRADYARIQLFENGTRHLTFYLYDGRYSDGNVIDYEYFAQVFQQGELVGADLITMDRTMYDYFLTLDEVWASDDGGNSLDATPANPNTNWSNDALGYFGAFSISRARIEVRDARP